MSPLGKFIANFHSMPFEVHYRLRARQGFAQGRQHITSLNAFTSSKDCVLDSYVGVLLFLVGVLPVRARNPPMSRDLRAHLIIKHLRPNAS